MELKDLPNQSAAVVVESAPLWVVWDMVNAGRYELVVVLHEDGSVRGVVQRDVIGRLAARVPEAPMKMVPMRRALVISPQTPLRDALAVLGNDDVEALLLELPNSSGFTALLRDELASASESYAA